MSDWRKILVTLALFGPGCIAGPSPHPSSTGSESPGDPQSSQDTSSGAANADDCLSSGGDWNGVECDFSDGADAGQAPFMDAASEGDALPPADAENDGLPSDATDGPEETSLSTDVGVPDDGASEAGPPDIG